MICILDPRTVLAVVVLSLCSSCSNGDPEQPPTPPPAGNFAVEANGQRLTVQSVVDIDGRKNPIDKSAIAEGLGILVRYGFTHHIHLFTDSLAERLTVLFLADDLRVVEFAGYLPGHCERGITSIEEASSALVCASKEAERLRMKIGDVVALSADLRDQTVEPPPTIVIKGKRLIVDVAENDDERSRGLMYRPRLSENHGMLFIYRREGTLGYYMKNTRIPLSLAYLRNDRKISSIHEMFPMDESTVESTEPVCYVLETNKGWLERNAVVPGDTVEFPDPLLRRLAK